MKKTTIFGCLTLVCLCCAQLSAGTIYDLDGFQCTFGDVVVNGSIDSVDGYTSGETEILGLTATASDLVVDISGWAANGDSVGISDLVLSDSGDVTGTVTYVWQDGIMLAQLSPADFGGLPFAGTVVAGTLAIAPGGNATMTDTVTGDTFLLPPVIAATFTYNGAYIDTTVAPMVPATVGTASASISVVEVPEPSTMILALFGVFGLIAVRRRK